jgi:hypothetical protein
MTIRLQEPQRLADTEDVQLALFMVRDGRPDSTIALTTGALDSVPPLYPALYLIRVRALGYQTATDTLRVAPGESWCVRVRLAEAVLLEPAVF